MSDTPPLPQLTDFEARIFRSVAVHYRPNGYHDQVATRFEGSGKIAWVMAARRLEKKGLLCRTRPCHWYLTELGKELALSTR